MYINTKKNAMEHEESSVSKCIVTKTKNFYFADERTFIHFSAGKLVRQKFWCKYFTQSPNHNKALQSIAEPCCDWLKHDWKDYLHRLTGRLTYKPELMYKEEVFS